MLVAILGILDCRPETLRAAGDQRGTREGCHTWLEVRFFCILKNRQVGGSVYTYIYIYIYNVLNMV